MEYAPLGSAGVVVSALGLGAGGPSRIGQRQGATMGESVRVVREAIDLGITIIDTAEAYRTEEIIGNALKDGGTADVIISSKVSPKSDDGLKSAAMIKQSLDSSLKRLGRERIDIYHVHGVSPQLYPEIRETVYPVLERMKKNGKIGSIGITEQFGADFRHQMLETALSDDLWDVIMIGYNMLNVSGRDLIRRASEQGVGVLDMFAVRRAFRTMEELRPLLADMCSQGLLDADELEKENPFVTALETGECASLAELAYRFCLHEPGINVVLCGTGSLGHLRDNRESADKPNVSQAVRSRIESLFGSINRVSGN